MRRRFRVISIVGLIASVFTIPQTPARSDSEPAPFEYISPNVYSPPKAIEAMLSLARLREGDVVYDLGSGDGRIVIAAVRHPGVRGVGIDIDPKEIAKARAAATRAGVADRATFVQQSFLTADFSEATVVTLYHFPSVFERLRPLLERQLAPRTRVVVLDFPVEGWSIAETRKLRDAHGIERTIFLYVVGAH